MATIADMIFAVRERLGDPYQHAPSQRHILRYVLDQTQSLFNQIANSNETWAVSDTTLTVSPNVEEYQLQITGKPFLMYTQDLSNPSHYERPIRVYDLQNLLLSYEGPRNGAYMFPAFAYSSNHTAAGVAFYQKDGADGWFARIRPVPQLSAQYRIIYGIGNWADSAALQSAPVLSEHHHLIEVRAAKAALPLARWSDDRKADVEQQKSLAMGLMAEEAQYLVDFQRYLRNLSQPRITFRDSGFAY